MAITAKSLADGQLAATKGTLYTVPGGTVAYVKFLHVHNTGSTTETVVIYVKRSGSSSRTVGRVILAQNEAADVLDKDATLTLSTGDVIEGETTNATTVDYTITGAEEA